MPTACSKKKYKMKITAIRQQNEVNTISIAQAYDYVNVQINEKRKGIKSLKAKYPSQIQVQEIK